MEWDIFICHASEDKNEIAKPLADALIQKGLKVWYDDYELKLGDSLLQKINAGIAKSRFGIVVLSKNFFNKHFPQNELDGLSSLEEQDRKSIIPVLHKIDIEFVKRHSPILAGRKAGDSSKGLKQLINDICEVVTPNLCSKNPRDKHDFILWEQWSNMKASYSKIPREFAIPAEEQLKLQKHNHLDLTIFNEFLKHIGMDFTLELPLNDSEYEIICNHRLPTIERVWELSEKNVANHSIELDNWFHSIFDYLAIEKSPPYFCDIIFVPGARATAVNRADKAVYLYRDKKGKKIYLSGNKPYYDESTNTSGLTEAEAFFIYITKISNSKIYVNENDIIVEDRPRNTHENVDFFYQYLSKKFNEEKKPVSIIAVTSPYHLRRTISILTHFNVISNHKIVSDIYSVAANSKFERENWFREKNGVFAVINEYWKIHGGRIVGQL